MKKLVSHVKVTVPPLSMTAVRQSNQRWRETKSRKHTAPVGTTFSFILNHRATIKLAFTQALGGIKVNGKCVSQTRKNRRQRSCRLTVTRGTLAWTGRAGTNRHSFHGRVSGSNRLIRPGRYTVIITARDPAGKHSKPQQLTFTIAK